MMRVNAIRLYLQLIAKRHSKEREGEVELEDGRKEQEIKEDIVETLYKSLNIIDTNNGLYLFILCNVATFVCMTTKITWLLVLIGLIVYWLYIIGGIVMYFYYKRQLKILHNELYGKIDEIDPIGKMHKSFKNVFITDMVFMILTSLIAMYFYY